MSRRLNVYLYGQKIGILSEDELGYLVYQYTSDALYPLSVRLPIRQDAYDKFYTEPFFDNLAPEGEALNIISKKFSISAENTFSILDKIGGDCAGAVSLYKGEYAQDTDTSLKKINEEKIINLIDILPNNPLLTGLPDSPRLSLAGVQSKFAVCKIDENYYQSSESHPTTHIIKITNARFKNLLENELFCMKLAQIVLDTINVDLYDLNGRRYLEIQRYDRQVKDGHIYRIHQEDFCQVLGYLARNKYQHDRGPKIRDCHDAILKYSSKPDIDTQKFIKQIIFNYLIGNTDAHAKNFSVLHDEKGILLSPPYDLISTEVYPENTISREIAMTVNGKGKYDAISKKDFSELFVQLGLNPKQVMESISDNFKDFTYIAEGVKDKLNSSIITKSDIYDNIIMIIKNRVKRLFET